MAADALALNITRSSAAMILNVLNSQVLIFIENVFQLPA